MIITKKLLLEAISTSPIGEKHIDFVISHLNSKNPALEFELKLHDLLTASLGEGLTILEAVGALECVKGHLQNDFYRSQSNNQTPQWLQ